MASIETDILDSNLLGASKRYSRAFANVTDMVNVKLSGCNKNALLFFTNPDPLTFFSMGELFFFVPRCKSGIFHNFSVHS